MYINSRTCTLFVIYAYKLKKNSFYTCSLLILYYLIQAIFRMHVHTKLYFGFYSYQTREHTVLKKPNKHIVVLL